MRTYNCAKAYIGSYIVGSNEFEQNIEHKYVIIQGGVDFRILRPVKINQSMTELGYSMLHAVVLYPATENAVIEITDSRGTRQLRLVKYKKGRGRRSTMFRARM